MRDQKAEAQRGKDKDNIDVDGVEDIETTRSLSNDITRSRSAINIATLRGKMISTTLSELLRVDTEDYESSSAMQRTPQSRCCLVSHDQGRD